MNSFDVHGYFLTAANAPLERRNFTLGPPERDHVIVAVAGCGLCHTDLSFLSGSVQTKHELPLVLGHEISGTVVAAGEGADAWMGRNVIVPAVLPCGECALCRDGRDNICTRQRMPGNDFHGGFASHVAVPARYLCALPDDLAGFDLAELSVIADAVTTPYQSLQRSGLRPGELAIVIGVGGIGIYMVQQARAAGATVLALDIDDARLATAARLGSAHVINSRDMSERDIKEKIRAITKEHGLPRFQWRVFETSGTAAGQAIAFSLLSYAGTVGVVGFTMDRITVRLSNVMAFDADVFGNWGCRPAHYPAVVDQVLKGAINLRDNIARHPLDSINDIIPRALAHALDARVIFVP